MVFTLVCVAALIIIIGVVFVEQGQRRIPVQYAKRMVGRRMYGGTSTYLPLKVNQAGVIPVIFASSLIYIPHLITQLIQSGSANPGTGWWQTFVADYLTDPSSPVYIAIYFGLIVFFTYFYVSITFNPDERADEMKKFGGFIPGIRPGKPTADYLQLRAVPDHPARLDLPRRHRGPAEPVPARSATPAPCRTCRSAVPRS